MRESNLFPSYDSITVLFTTGPFCGVISEIGGVISELGGVISEIYKLGRTSSNANLRVQTNNNNNNNENNN